jgi:cysteine-S-conjugate beta-lyase
MDPPRLNGLSIDTVLANFDPCPNDPYGATSMPIYQTATFKQVGANDFGDYDYTRSGNPTRTALQDQIALLENSPGAKSFCFSTGMAAIAAVLRLVQNGEEIIVNDDSYGGTYRIMSKVAQRQGIKITYVNLAGTEGLENLKNTINAKTRLVMIESPTNPMQRVCSINALACICHENSHPIRTLLCVDNTMMSPILCRPLELEADLVVHSATKFMSGHSDTMAGVVTVRNIPDDGRDLSDSLYFYQNAEGTALAPFDCWLVLRGLKTMALRVKAQQANAIIVANWLKQCSYVTSVLYTGIEGFPERDLHFSQASGPGSVVCFLTGNMALSEHIVTATKLFKITVSFGSVSSLISVPMHMSHASIPEDVRSAREFPSDLVRLCIGIEEPQDLINDLQQAMESFR